MIFIFLNILSQKAVVRFHVWLSKTCALKSEGSLFSFLHDCCTYTRCMDIYLKSSAARLEWRSPHPAAPRRRSAIVLGKIAGTG